jgi:hypothetical protein
VYCAPFGNFLAGGGFGFVEEGEVFGDGLDGVGLEGEVEVAGFDGEEEDAFTDFGNKSLRIELF